MFASGIQGAIAFGRMALGSRKPEKKDADLRGFGNADFSRLRTRFTVRLSIGFCLFLLGCGEDEIRLVSIGPYRQAYELQDSDRFKFSITSERSALEVRESNLLVATYVVTQPTESEFLVAITQSTYLNEGMLEARFRRHDKPRPYGCGKAYVYSIDLSNGQELVPHLPDCED